MKVHNEEFSLKIKFEKKSTASYRNAQSFAFGLLDPHPPDFADAVVLLGAMVVADLR